jgi:hypothetical protein
VVTVQIIQQKPAQNKAKDPFKQELKAAAASEQQKKNE